MAMACSLMAPSHYPHTNADLPPRMFCDVQIGVQEVHMKLIRNKYLHFFKLLSHNRDTMG